LYNTNPKLIVKRVYLKVILFLFLFVVSIFASTMQEDIWWKGDTFLKFLAKNHIDNSIYFNLSKTDKELCTEIYAGIKYQTLYDDKGNIEQVLIPISEEMQIHLYKDKKQKFKIEIIPIKYHKVEQTIMIKIKSSIYKDIIDTTLNQKLANEVIRAFKHTVNFRRIKKNDKIVINYIQKIRESQYFGTPEILAAMLQIGKRKYYIFENKNTQRYYDQKGRSLTSFFLKVPLRYTRISSKFTYKRWHPILHKYLAHLGIDYAAPTGRSIHAAADGKIIFKGRKGGYGNAIIIRHKGGYRSLYAHMSRFAHVKRGQYVKQGKTIGYVGTTGRSTGPHLHFGLYKNSKAINPASVLHVTKNRLTGKAKKIFLQYVKKEKRKLNSKHYDKPLKLSNLIFSETISLKK
jgi:murein DD-endopeptidase MepM/ murein hydrolase activator NlpD